MRKGGQHLPLGLARVLMLIFHLWYNRCLYTKVASLLSVACESNLGHARGLLCLDGGNCLVLRF